MGDKITAVKRTQIKAFTAVALLSAVICLSITCAQPSLAQQQQDWSGSNSNLYRPSTFKI